MADQARVTNLGGVPNVRDWVSGMVSGIYSDCIQIYAALRIDGTIFQNVLKSHLGPWSPVAPGDHWIGFVGYHSAGKPWSFYHENPWGFL